MAAAHVDNRPYCAKHDTHYSAMSPCDGCADDPAPAFVIEHDDASADPRLLEIECEVRSLAADVRTRIQTRLKQRTKDGDKDAIGESSLCKLIDSYCKLTNIEVDRVSQRSDRQYKRDLLEHEKLMAGLRKAH